MCYMSRGPERKDIDWDTVEEIIEDNGDFVSTEKLRKEYCSRKDDTMNWNTLNDRLQESEDFVSKRAGNYNMWTSAE